jgi:hypothetical protein
MKSIDVTSLYSLTLKEIEEINSTYSRFLDHSSQYQAQPSQQLFTVIQNEDHSIRKQFEQISTSLTKLIAVVTQLAIPSKEIITNSLEVFLYCDTKNAFLKLADEKKTYTKFYLRFL